MVHDIKKLPKWAQRMIDNLKYDLTEMTKSKERIESMIPWTEPNMEWFTVGVHKVSPYKLFVLSKDSAHPVCYLGPKDRLFIGRSR
jgi:hypothetical protein